MTGEVSLLQALITIAFGALAGGLTNAVAIWMLFHPHEPRGFGRIALQGAIPKNRNRLAKTIGRTVGERLLTPEDLASQLAAPAIREAFDRTVRDLVVSILTTGRGSLREELPPALVDEIETVVAGLGERLADRLAAHAATPAFAESITGILERARRDFGDRPVGDVLTEVRRGAIRDQVETWVSDFVASAELEDTIRSWLERHAERLREDGMPLLDRLPSGLVAAVERAIAAYLPVALERLAGILRDPDARARIERTLHELFRRFLKDLMLHERIVARLVVTERTIARLLDNLGHEGTEQLAAMLDEPEMRAHVARSVNDAVVSFLRRPLSEHVASLGPERLAGVTDTVARYVVALLRDPTTSATVVEQLDRALLAAEHRTWGDLLDRLPPERAAAWGADIMGSQLVRGWIVEGWAAAVRSIIARPIGRPADLLGDSAVERISLQVGPPLWIWVQAHVPRVVAQLDIQTMVEQKVMGFSLDRIEQIVRQTTQRELDLIVRLGYLLGAIVGAVAFGVSVVLP